MSALLESRPRLAVTWSPGLVLPEEDLRAVLTAAAREDVSRGGRVRARGSAVVLWSGAWDGPVSGVGGGATAGSAEPLGEVAWSWEVPARHWTTVHRVTLTPAGAAAGLTPAGLLRAVLGLAGVPVPQAA